MDVAWPVTGWRRRLISGVALATFLGFLPVGTLQDGEYRSSVTVFVDPDAARVANATSDPAAQRAMIDTFVGLASSDASVRAAAAQSGLSPADLRQALNVAAVGATNAVGVSVTAAQPSSAETAAQTIGRLALIGYAQQSLAMVQTTVGRFQGAYDDSTAELNDYLTSVGEAAPEDHYGDVQQTLIDVSAGVIPGAVTPLREELARLQPIVLRYRELLATQSRLGNALQSAQARALELQATIDAGRDSNNINAATTEELPRLIPVLRLAALMAVAAALLTAAGLYVVQFWEGWRSHNITGERGAGRHAHGPPTAFPSQATEGVPEPGQPTSGTLTTSDAKLATRTSDGISPSGKSSPFATEETQRDDEPNQASISS